jgi:acyl dehydratase
LRLTASDLLGRTAERQIYEWTERDYLLYALALGFGADVTRSAEFPFVYERDLKIVPTFPTVLAWLVEPTFESLGADPESALHVGQAIEIHRPLKSEESVAVTGIVVGIQDKGHGRGAIIAMRQEIRGLADSRPIATLLTTCFARGAGGCGSAGELGSAAVFIPDRTSDHQVSYDVRPDAALLYRLTGDRNPLHADPRAAVAAGFPSPILHGLCTFGMTCRAVLERVVDWRAELIISQSARFTGVVFPGDCLDIALWVEDGREVCFEVRVAGRGPVARGHATLGSPISS